jgi:hypothetical protein
MPSSRVTSEIRRLQLPAQVGFTIVAASGQSANLTEWQNNSGTILARVTSAGLGVFTTLNVNSTSTTLGASSVAQQFGVVIGAATSVGAVVRAATSQSANLQEWQDSSGTAMTWISATGGISLPRGSTFRFNAGIGVERAQITSNTANDLIFGTAGGTEIFKLAGGATPGGATLTVGTASAIGLIVKGAASQSGDLTQWQNSSGTVLSRVSSAGAITSAAATAGIGYSTGAGATATQGSGSGKSTGVTLNNVTGQITMNNATLNADTTVSFTLTNSAIAATDMVLVQHISAGTLGAYTCTAAPAAGSATVYVRNITAGNLGEAIVIQFLVIKAVTA